MTVTIDRTEITRPSSRPDAAQLLLAVLDDAIAVCAHQDPDRLHGWTAAGGALVSLSSLARTASNALDTDPATSLTDAPGVVVVRDLVAATRLLRVATSGATHDGTAAVSISQLVPAAKAVHASLLEAVTPAA